MAIIKGIDKKLIVEFVIDNWKTWKDAREDRESIWRECIRHYMLLIDKSKFDGWPWRVQISRPMTQEISDSISSSIKNALFPINEDFFEIEGQDDIGKQFAHMMQSYLKKVLIKNRFTTTMNPFIKQIVVIGNSSGGVNWEFQQFIKKRWLNGEVVQQNDIISNNSFFQTDDMFEVVYDPYVQQYKFGTMRIQRSQSHITAIQGNKNFSNISELESSVSNRTKFVDNEDSAESETKRRDYGIDKGQLNKEGIVEIHTMTGDIVFNGKIYINHLIVIGNRSVLLRFEENPLWNGDSKVFSNYQDTAPDEPLGRGVAEPIRGNQKLLDTLSCQKVEVVSQHLGGFWMISRDSGVDPADLIQQPYGVVPVNDMNGVQSMTPPGNPTAGFEELATIKTESDTSAGTSSTLKGGLTQFRTATEALQSGSGSTNRINDIVTNIGEMAIEPALNFILMQELQFNYRKPGIMPDEAWDGQYIVKFNGAKNSASRELAQQLFINWLGVIGSNPSLSQFLEPEEVGRESLKLFGIKNDKLMRLKPLSEDFPSLSGGQSQQSQQSGNQQVVNNVGNTDAITGQ